MIQVQTIQQTDLPLRDIHLPEITLWWPPALGWWLLCLLLIIISILILFFIRQRQNHRLSAIYLAKQELDSIKNEFKLNQDKSILVRELSILIRRVNISLFTRAETAALTGQEWLRFLDKFTDNNEFSNGIGHIFIEAPYQETSEYDSEALLDLISLWLDAVRHAKGHHDSF